MKHRESRLKKIFNVGLEISRIKDIDLLLEMILGEARAFTNSDAGSINIREGDFLRFSYTQSDTLQRQLPPGRKLPYYTFSIPIGSTSIAGYVAANG